MSSAAGSEARAEGRGHRGDVPRSAHREWSPPSDRADPIAVLTLQERDRVPSLLPLRHERMGASPLAFFRGAAAIMAGDLASTPTTALRVQACGDAHLANFGVFATPERNLVFDVNDFDETLQAPFEWDVKRLASSLVVAGRGNGLPEPVSRAAARAAVQTYRTELRRYASMGHLDVWYARIDVASVMKVLRGASRRNARRVARKARRRTSLAALSKLTTMQSGRRRIVDDPPLIEHLDGLDEEVAARYADYRATLPADRRLLLDRYSLVDAARKVVGVGSVGTECAIVLLEGKSTADPLFLQIKTAARSVLEPYAGPSPFSDAGQRVVEGQLLIQAASDIFLGWTGSNYVRQLRDMKGGVVPEALDATDLAVYGRVCGAGRARAHARSGSAQVIAGYLGQGEVFDAAVEDFAAAYADQTERDYGTFRGAVESDLRAGRPAVPA
jgi:uncharacterized protein (DUF2252 family)